MLTVHTLALPAFQVWSQKAASVDSSCCYVQYASSIIEQLVHMRLILLDTLVNEHEE